MAMTKIYKVIIAALFFVCTSLFASQANARVCFATDPDCGSGGNFSEIDPDYMSNLCLENGYTSIATDCQSTVGMQIGAYCPYDHKYAICCGLEYAYTKCTPPLKAAGVCGGKLKCECDTSKFAYMQKTASVCRNVLNGTEYTNSRGAGGSCSYMGYDHTLQASMINIRFAECTCDRGLYPKTEEECSSIGASTAGNVCTDSNGNNFYSSCLCGPEYKYISSDCKYGTYVKDPLCQQGDVYKTKRCCDCNSATYPYADYGDIDESVETYATCEHERGCTRGSRYRATSCKLGYKVVNGKCEPKSCGEIIQDYLADRKITSYALYETGKTPTATNVIIGDDTGYGAKFENFYNKKVISGQAYASTIYGNDTLTKLIKSQCTTVPQVYVSSTDMTSTRKLDFTSVELKTSSWWNKGGFTCTNCSLDIFMLYNQSTTELKYDSSKPNRDNMYVKLTGAYITANYTSVGYHYELGSLGFKVENPSLFAFVIAGKSNSEKITMTGEKFSVLGLAALKYVDLKVSPVCIGTVCGYGDTSSGVYFNPGDVYRTSSTLWLDNSKYWLYEDGNIRSLHMTTSSMVGNELAGSTASITLKSNGTLYEYNTITFAQLWKYCSKIPGGAYPFMNPSIRQSEGVYSAVGAIQSRGVGCFYYSASVRDGEGHSKPDDARCKINGNNYQYGYAQASGNGCRWRDGDDSDRTPYFQFNGNRGWAVN